MNRTRFLASLVFLGAVLVGGTPARGAPFYGPEPADPTVPSPEAFLGRALGSDFTEHSRLVAYLEALAAASPRVRLERYGETYGGRPLVLLTISSPGNLQNASRLQEAYARLADPRTMNLGEARGRSRDLPVAVWLSFNIHGNEPSSSEAAMALAYHLAAAEDEATRDLLNHAVLLLDPCLNPDGRDRYVHWFKDTVGGSPDPLAASREHHEPWPGGRYNHYLFDLNRDWAWLTQTESRARVRLYRAWKPQVHVDFHEMWSEATYFFFPPERPIHTLYPDQIRKWYGIFGRGNAAAFDAAGWRYYTAEAFDLYYPGYGDSWPTFQGAIGMTYEQAGHARAGLRYRRRDGDTLTLKERIEHHYSAALATLETAAANREALLLDFYRFFQQDPSLPDQTYLFPPGTDPSRTAELVDLLLEHGAEVYRSRESLHPRNLRDYRGRLRTRPLPEGTYVVSMNQPLHRFLRAVLEPEAALPDTLFYDVSAWSLPLAFGVDAYITDASVGGRLELLTSPPETPGSVVHDDASYAYLVSWDRNGAPRAASMLLERGIAVHFTTREITVEDALFSPGSLVVFTAGNPDSLPTVMETVARECGVEVLGVDTGLTPHGPDLGSARVHRLLPVRVALLSGDPVDPPSLGACWFLLDRLYRIPHSLVEPSQLTRRNLDDYDVLVLPDTRGGDRAYEAVLDSSRVAAVKDWIRGGGVLVGLGNGAFFSTRDISGLSSVAMAPREADDTLSDEEKDRRDKERRIESSRQREQRKREDALPGTIFRVRVDPLHPLGFGYSGETRVLKISNRALELGPPGTNVAVFTSSPKVSGYASTENTSRLVDRPFLVDEPVGRGHVVMYVEDPNFRLFWYGLTRLFLNSIFFLPNLEE